jgi:fucose permease
MLNNKIATIICCAIIVVFAVELTIISPLIIEISRTFSLDIVGAGVIFTIQAIGFVTFIFVGGVLSDKWGKKTILQIALTGFTIAIFLFSQATSFYAACMIMFFLGGFGGVIEGVTNALVADLNPLNKEFYVNLAQVFFGVGAVIGPVTTGMMISSGMSWRVCYIIIGIISAVLALAFAMLKIPAFKEPEGITLAGFKRIVQDRIFLLICLCMILYTGAEVGAWGWMCTFLEEGMGFSAAKSGIAVAVFWTAMTLGRLFCGPFISRYSIKQIVVALAFTSAAVTVLSGFVRSEALMWLVIAAMGITYSSQWPLIVSYGSAHMKTSSGTVFSMLVGSGGIGNMIVPYILGIIGNNTSISIAMLSPGVLLFTVGLIFLRLGRSATQEAECIKL